MRTASRLRLAVTLALSPLVWLAACGGEPRPAALEASTPCAFCRMTVSDVHFAAQLVAAGEEPLFFDDIGCLAGYLAGGAGTDRLAYVADHRTGEWVRASDAVFSHASRLASPMNSHLIAHASAESRDMDPAARGAEPRTPEAIFGPTGPPGGAR